MSAIVDFSTVPELFEHLVAFHADSSAPALQYKDRKSKAWTPITWAELDRRVKSFAGYLHKQGVRKGDRVAILSENRPEWAITDLAMQSLGAVNVALYTSVPASQVEYIVRDSEAKMLVVSTSMQLRKAEEIFENCEALQTVVTMSQLRTEHGGFVEAWQVAEQSGATYREDHAPDLDALRAAVTPADLCSLIYTSGTTGNPKGVMLTHDNFCSNVKSALACVPFGPGDHHLSFLPLCHSFERTAGYLAVLAAGGQISYAESVDTVNRNLVELGPTVMISVPRLFERVYNVISKSVEEGPPVKRRIFDWSVASGMKYAAARKRGRSVTPILSLRNSLAQKLVFSKLHQRLGGNLRFAVSGGAALPRAIGEFFEAAGILLIEGYGLTETSPVLAVNPINAPRYGAVGHIIPGVTVGIQRLSDGEIVGSMRGDDYPSDLTTEEGEIVVRGPNVMKGYWRNTDATKEAIDAEGWYHTGDVGRFVEGYLQITDRIKHMIVSKGGKNIYPGPIEDDFRTIPWIDQLLIVGEGREFLTALVVPDMDALAQYARDNNIAYDSEEELINSEPVQALFKQEFRRYGKRAAAHERIRDFRLISEPFTIENNLMTPTLKPRRRIIEKEYAAVIDEMYAQVV